MLAFERCPDNKLSHQTIAPMSAISNFCRENLIERYGAHIRCQICAQKSHIVQTSGKMHDDLSRAPLHDHAYSLSNHCPISCWMTASRERQRQIIAAALFVRTE